MDPIQPTPVTPTPARDSATISNERLTAASDFQSFLTLLTAQLKNQDPLDPLDSTQFVAQLASFSTVEQLIGANERLDALSSVLGGGELVRLTDWIGREVAPADGIFRATGTPVSFPLATLPSAERVEGVVSTPEGVVLRRFTVTGTDGQAEWDGLNDRGAPVSGQNVRIDLYQLRGDEILLEQRAEVFTRVVGISDRDGKVQVQLADGRRIDPDDVGAVRE